jgi:hypothetical protein
LCFFIIAMLGLYNAKIWALVVEKLTSSYDCFSLNIV